jgi:hypothetical protein
MNCNTFKNRLSDYMENSMIFEMKQAMEKHLYECESCKSLYEEEKKLDEMLKEALKVDDIKFNSSRASIIKNIDKSRYNPSLANKMKFHLIKYKFKYASYAAVLAVVLFSVPMALRFMGTSANNQSREIAIETAEENRNMKSASPKAEMFSMEATDSGLAAESTEALDKKEASSESQNQDNMGINSVSEIQNQYVPRFNRIDLSESAVAEFATNPIASPDGKLKAQLQGRGEGAGDEGIANIFITSNNNQKWALELVDNIKHTPMSIVWVDNENLLATIASEAYGHATYGGNVYMVNANTGNSVLVYKTSSINKKVSAIFKEDNSLKFVVKYDEVIDNTVETREEEVRINFNYITDKNDQAIKVLYEYANDIMSKNADAALSKITTASRDDYMTQVGDIKSINSMEIIEVIDVTEINNNTDSVEDNNNSRVYYIQVRYHMNNTAINAQGSETIYQKVELVKEKTDSEWKIKGIYMVPQSKAD